MRKGITYSDATSQSVAFSTDGPTVRVTVADLDVVRPRVHKWGSATLRGNTVDESDLIKLHNEIRLAKERGVAEPARVGVTVVPGDVPGVLLWEGGCGDEVTSREGLQSALAAAELHGVARLGQTHVTAAEVSSLIASLDRQDAEIRERRES